MERVEPVRSEQLRGHDPAQRTPPLLLARLHQVFDREVDERVRLRAREAAGEPGKKNGDPAWWRPDVVQRICGRAEEGAGAPAPAHGAGPGESSSSGS
ncbi:hypothetical protein ZWY2020_001464 [Hordeum vulgare]|nr:hypothetical protein ZWY2020_041331 [Hordeum vulgare]KAI4970550.1 hypothetical protein ZWY2020_001464 [Hordeum vulgare]